MINMKGLKEIVLAGALALGIAGCSSKYVGTNEGYSCEKRSTGTIIAIKGDAEVKRHNGFWYGKVIHYENMNMVEAVKAIDACDYAFKELDGQKKTKE